MGPRTKRSPPIFFSGVSMDSAVPGPLGGAVLKAIARLFWRIGVLVRRSSSTIMQNCILRKQLGLLVPPGRHTRLSHSVFAADAVHHIIVHNQVSTQPGPFHETHNGHVNPRSAQALVHPVL